MTRYELFRRRIAPVLFLGLVGMIALDTCNKNERTHATIVLDLGAARRTIRTLEAQLVVDGELINTFQRTALGADLGPTRFEVAMPSKDGELRVTANGKQVVRRIHAEEGATVTVSLEADFR
ncbi:MAG: hypothetical protein WKG01_41465 [Kofleriaceae bacterium]